MEVEKKIGCMQGCLTAVGLMIAVMFGILILISFSIQGCIKEINNSDKSALINKNRPVDELGFKYREQWSAGVNSDDAIKVVRIKLSGAISRELTGSVFNGGIDAASAVGARNRIRAAKNDKSVKSIILEINSPGGEVTMSDLVWNELKEFKASATNRVVFAHLMDMACSGGYYVAVAADYIYALPTTITGSIGVIIPAYNASELAEKIGVKPVSIASSGNKDLLNPLAPTNPEHIAIVKKTIDSAYERFVDLVADGRKLSKNRVKEIADGRIFSAQDALDNKLIDGIGYERDMLKFVSSKLGGKIKVVKYETDFSFENFFSNDMVIKFTESLKRSIMSDFTRPSVMQYR
jgi:protease-4